MLNTLRKVEDLENHVRWIDLTTVLNMGGGGGGRKYAIISYIIWPYINMQRCLTDNIS